MEKVKNILVALDLSSLDTHLIEYTSFLAEKFKADNVYFVHNIKKYEISDLFEEELNQLNLDQLIGDELNEKVAQHFTANVDWEVFISEDSNTESLIHYIANKYQINLAIVGNKAAKDGTGVVTSKLLTLLKCSILTVPKTTQLSLETVWVGTDFSSHSRKSFFFAEELRGKQPITINALHIAQVPIQFSPYVAREDAQEKIEKHMRQKSAKFFKKLAITDPDNHEFLFAKDKSISQKFLVEIEKRKPSLVILSDKGGSNISTLLIGSLTEELFNETLSSPLLVVR
ncbi:nucleotide-binding universal stress UspA family protein [Leeuwenhoekiella aestuarii]|uniref:Nucleotide-binding universal stress UspA family protein n=1 Tax=Leeuwenhoekiella aestuarii TaxID=2249426 RepID=A0A4Q0NSA5_9FLAO|nr:universal stress protein [Leeuwenhoekiella aestuarii]RXG13324.1 nucleotide-binding universal stress UspA family protein [Leeuwenhoekiella aestuarii]RXG14945.1 nucleotide-binding universal stress UspA family protein [Leeuwenhoekiella aestuarii]